MVVRLRLVHGSISTCEQQNLQKEKQFIFLLIISHSEKLSFCVMHFMSFRCSKDASQSMKIRIRVWVLVITNRFQLSPASWVDEKRLQVKGPALTSWCLYHCHHVAAYPCNGGSYLFKFCYWFCFWFFRGLRGRRFWIPKQLGSYMLSYYYSSFNINSHGRY